MSVYALGEVPRISIEVRDLTGALVDPTTITLTVQKPDGTTETPVTPVRDSLGLYHYDYTPATAGRYAWRAVTTGAGAGAREGELDVTPAFGQAGIITPAQIRDATNIPNSTSDDELWPMAMSATEVIENLCGPMVRAERTDTIRGVCSQVVLLPVAPVLSVTSLTVKRRGTTVATYTDTQLDLDGGAGVLRILNGLWVQGDATVAYVVGRTSIPYMARKTALDLVQSWWENGQQSPAGGPILGPDSGEADFTDVRVPGGVPRWAVDQLEQAGLLRSPSFA